MVKYIENFNKFSTTSLSLTTTNIIEWNIKQRLHNFHQLHQLFLQLLFHLYYPGCTRIFIHYTLIICTLSSNSLAIFSISFRTHLQYPHWSPCSSTPSCTSSICNQQKPHQAHQAQHQDVYSQYYKNVILRHRMKDGSTELVSLIKWGDIFLK